MNMTQKITASAAAAAVFSAILFTSAGATKLAQSAADVPQSVQPAAAVQPLNSKETPESQLKDMTY